MAGVRVDEDSCRRSWPGEFGAPVSWTCAARVWVSAAVSLLVRSLSPVTTEKLFFRPERPWNQLTAEEQRLFAEHVFEELSRLVERNVQRDAQAESDAPLNKDVDEPT